MRIVLKAASAVVVLATVAVGGCATVTRGTTNDIQIQSEPAGAAVTTSLNHQCTAPCTIKVGRKEEFQVTFQLNGYEDQTIPVTTQMAGAGAAGLAGNVLIGGVVGIGVDAFSGATLEHVPNPVIAVMKRLGPPPKVGPDGPRRRQKAPVRKAPPKAKAEPAPKVG